MPYLPYLPYLYEVPYLYAIQAGMTIWMVLDAHKRGVDQYWYWLILMFQPIGAWAYFFMYKVRDFRGGKVGAGAWFQRRASLQELRYRVDRAPTMVHRLELAERLIESDVAVEAVPHLQAVLAHEPEHCEALYALATCHRRQGQAEQAVPLLQRLLKKHPGWSHYSGWHALIDARVEAGDAAGAVTSCRDLLKAVPTLENKCRLAEHLSAAGQKDEARQVLNKGLEDYAYMDGRFRRRDRRWAREAKQLLKQLG
jgi:hypothetical protein